MAEYKVVDATQLDADLKVVADAIRIKGGTTEQLAFPSGMESAILAIVAGGGSPSNITVSEIIMETTVTNARDGKNYIDTFVNTNVVTLILNKKLLQTGGVLVYAEAVLIFYIPDNKSDVMTNEQAIRNRESTLSIVKWGIVDYDFKFNVGDEYYLIELS